MLGKLIKILFAYTSAHPAPKAASSPENIISDKKGQHQRTINYFTNYHKDARWISPIYICGGRNYDRRRLTVDLDPRCWCECRDDETCNQEENLGQPPVRVPCVSLVLQLARAHSGEEHYQKEEL
jgi:hypothetical protein